MDTPATAHQPQPHGTGVAVLPLVVAEVRQCASERVAAWLNTDLIHRTVIGTATYGEPLQTHNGRDALVDAYQEALDLLQYLKQAEMESPERLALSGMFHDALLLCRQLCWMIHSRHS